jgi:hypothetical protein
MTAYCYLVGEFQYFGEIIAFLFREEVENAGNVYQTTHTTALVITQKPIKTN